MTAKEKAKELVNKMFNCDKSTPEESMAMLYPHAKQCALIAVDEIMTQYKTPVVSHIVTAYKSAKDFNENFLDIERQLKDFTTYQILYWNGVKNEIELL